MPGSFQSQAHEEALDGPKAGNGTPPTHARFCHAAQGATEGPNGSLFRPLASVLNPLEDPVLCRKIILSRSRGSSGHSRRSALTQGGPYRFTNDGFGLPSAGITSSRGEFQIKTLAST